jgi:acetylornithine/N-succinyldiaminopimelate aminotransferase
VDEIQTGIGRTGKFLGLDHEGVLADAIVLAKGLGGGFPIGALLVRERFATALPPGTHGSTFGGNALASRAARAVLAVVEEEKLVEGARIKGERLAKGLTALIAKHPKRCTEQRGRGLLQGLVLAKDVDPRAMLGKVRDHGVLLTIAGTNVLRFSPPLVIKESEIDEALSHLDAALSEVGS